MTKQGIDPKNGVSKGKCQIFNVESFNIEIYFKKER